MRTLTLLALLATLTTASPQRAAADYMLAPLAEHHTLVAPGGQNGWQLIGRDRRGHPRKVYTLVLRHEGRQQEVPVDLFFLCDRIDSNVLCTGDHVKAMSTYLDGLEGLASREGRERPPLLVELGNAKKGQALRVVGLWAWDADKAGEKAARGVVPPGLWRLRTLAGVKDAKPAAADLRARIVARSPAGWKALLDPQRK